LLPAPIPDNEAQRLAALQRYCVLDTVPEPAFDRLTHILQHVLQVPTVLVSLVDSERQWFKSRVGLDAVETPRDISFCGHAVFHRIALIVPDATKDPRFADNPLVAGPLGLRFYAGAPLITSDGFALGTLCAIDYVARPAPTEAQLDVMAKLADAVVAALELRASAHVLEARARLSHVLGQLAAIAHHAIDMTAVFEPILAELCAFTGARIGHVYVREDGADLFVSSGIWHGADDAHFAALRDGTREFCPASADALSSAVLSSQEPVSIADLAMETGLRARLACAAGLRAAMAFPVLVGTQVYAIVECYSDRAGTALPDHLTAAEYAATQLGRLAERGRAERLKNEFVSTVSHELRTPLTSIAGALELLDAGIVGALPAKIKDVVSIAYHNSRRLIRLINDILDIEKIESGCMTFDLQPQPLAPLIERAVAEVAAFAQSMDVRLAFRSPAIRAVARVDADRFIQVVTNLVSNAIKFSPSGATVTLTLVRCDDLLRISVADCGPGIPEAFRSRIFCKFAQADGSDSRRLAGSGLGLAIVKNIVEHQDGAVGFETECGRGTVFHVDLPEWHENADADNK
jgi:signal transduction histidine kinase